MVHQPAVAAAVTAVVATVAGSFGQSNLVAAFVVPKLGVNSLSFRTRPTLSVAADDAATTTTTRVVSATSSSHAKVDMNVYNVDLETAVEEWTAQLLRKSVMQEEGVSLGVRNSTQYMVDTLSFSLPRAGGLGLILTEIAGGREDGLGITLVTELVEGGNAEGSGILPGDSLVGLQVDRVDVVQQAQEEESFFGDPTNADASPSSSSSSAIMSEVTESTSVSTECLGYDATVNAIFSLPPVEENDETVLITVKRIRRRPKVTIQLQYPPSQDESDVTLELFAGENLRRALLVRGIKLNDALAKRFDSRTGGGSNCGAEGTCATCAVAVVRGNDLLSPSSLKEQQIFRDQQANFRMACKTMVGYGMKQGEMVIQVNPRQWDEYKRD